MSQGPCWKEFTPLLVLGKKGRGGEKVLVTPYHQGIDCGPAGREGAGNVQWRDPGGTRGRGARKGTTGEEGC